jgi:DNA-binding transcriptional ArsR family regulator
MTVEPSELFKVLGVDTRVRIINLFKSGGPLGVKHIAEQVGVTSAAVSQHLKILKQAGLVRNERRGYWIPYSIDEEALERCRQVLTEVCTCECGGTGKFRQKELRDTSLESLRRYSEELESELKLVRERMDEIEGGKK